MACDGLDSAYLKGEVEGTHPSTSVSGFELHWALGTNERYSDHPE